MRVFEYFPNAAFTPHCVDSLRVSSRSLLRGYETLAHGGNEGDDDFQFGVNHDGAGSVVCSSNWGLPMGASRFSAPQGGLGAPSDTRSVSGYSLPDPAHAAGAVMAGMTDEGRDEFSKGVLSTRSPSVADGDDASEVGGMSEFQSVLDSDVEGPGPVSRSSRRTAGQDNSCGAPARKACLSISPSRSE